MISTGGLHHGGAEQVVASLCRHLDPDRFNVSVCWRMSLGEIGQEMIEQGFDLVGLPEIDPNVSPYLRFLLLKRVLKERQIDVLHTHDTGSLVDAAQCRLFGSKVKLIHTFHYGNYPHMKATNLWMEKVFCRMAHLNTDIFF